MSNVLHLNPARSRSDLQKSDLPQPSTPSLKAARQRAQQQGQASGAGLTDQDALRKAALLELLGRKPVTFHRIYAEIAGGVLPAIWLTQAMAFAAKTNETPLNDKGGTVFTMTARECEEETGLTRSQQAMCRRKLMQAGLISAFGKEGRMARYLLHRDVIGQRLLNVARPLAQQLTATSTSQRTASR